MWDTKNAPKKDKVDQKPAFLAILSIFGQILIEFGYF